MNTLLQKIDQDRLAARKVKDDVRASILTVFFSDAVNIGKNLGNRETTEDEVIKLIRNFINTAKDNIKIYKESNKVSALEKTVKEIEILEEYLPIAPSNEEVTAFINNLITTNGWGKEKSTIGKVMKELKVKYGSLLDGKVASTLINESLGF